MSGLNLLPNRLSAVVRKKRSVKTGLAVVAGAVAVAGAAALAYNWGKKWHRKRQAAAQLHRWCQDGPAHEPVVDCEVVVEHGLDGEDVDTDVVEIPVGLLFECERLRTSLRELLLPNASADNEKEHHHHNQSSSSSSAPKTEDEELDVELIEALAVKLNEAKMAVEGTDEDPEPVVMKLSWIDLAALAQLTYWYDRRDRGAEYQNPEGNGGDQKEERLTEAKYGRWTRKLNREKVIYGTVALRYRSRAHLGQKVFRRPAGVDVTRLKTLRRAAAMCGHASLIELVEETMDKLQLKNVAKLTWEEVKRHTSKDDLWLLIDNKVYDVTPFLGLHPGGGQLIVDVAGKDATSAFELTHGEGLRYSLKLLNQFFIGVCVDSAGQAEPAEPQAATPEFLATLRSITDALHTFDEAKASGEAQGILR
mmetsp:Transcript_30144/g.65144  ORF Transcript_30144/g.65144 Transcript_30144/m.65144 type:complete len:421 (+) Transcript_30144:125-1387(+)|eukprot:CAMPEP_0206427558 /NCGR_PEP_ID=MMETSP0324_2-20121206/5109_1 /ASSEMBLY_ACC=CAM_ASM_000836 /TAXON_ID=2866 /ORGANISM="Crypthecodinium cohnii, Strain Seligo" /LENGTH=420 /DNA_ID=CAMNT_0053892855 /DNA_START=44 /DNA_END=1306 /DNA_ORIENTATION=-